MRTQKQTAVPEKTSNGSDDKGESYVLSGPSKKSKRNAVGHKPDTEEEPCRKTTPSTQQPVSSGKPAGTRGRGNRRARYARLTVGGKAAASVDDAEPGFAVKHAVAQPDLQAREKQPSRYDERRSEDGGGRHREKYSINKSRAKRAVPGLHRSDREALLEESEAVAVPLTHKRLLAPQLQDQERQHTETEMLSSGTEKEKHSEQVVRHKAVMEVDSPAAIIAPRSAAELLSDEGGSSVSTSGARKSGHSMETTGFNRTDMKRAVVVAIVCAAFVAIVVLLARLVAMHRSDGAAFAPSTWLKEMDKHCNSLDCLTAVKFIAAAMNVSADPCTDFYAFVCGRWRSYAPVTKTEPDWTSSASRNVSYMASMRSDYVAAANESLLRAAHGSDTSDQQLSHMSKVYASCLAFFVDKPLRLTTAWRAANIYANLWLEAKTFQESLFLAVTHQLHFQLGSVLYVTYDGQVVHISPGTAILRHVKAGVRHAIVMHAVETLLPNYNTVRQRPDVVDRVIADGQLVDAIAKLDDVVFNQTDTLPPVEIALTELDSSKWNWTEVFTAQSSVQPMALPIKARVTNIAGVRAILESLSSQEDMRATKIYLMLVPFAKYFGLEERARVHRRLPRDDIRNELCVTAVETMFGDVYQRWMTTELAGSDSGAELRRMLSGVLTAADKVLEITRGVILDYDKMLAATYPTRMYPLDNDTLPTMESNYGSDFVANAVRFAAGRGSTARPLLDFDALSADWSDREVAQRLLIPDFYYAHTAQVVLNYGTVGYYLARQAFWAGSPLHWAENDSHGNSSAVWDLTAHTRCLATYVKHTSGIEMSGDEPWWRDAVQARWAVEVSFRAAAFRDAKIAQERSLKQLFFLRFGHTFCAMPRRSQRDTAATACRVATMTLPAFAGAFGCPVMVGIGC
ncbi:hypothetical protein HPB49_008354 [Dermacentor silvarum]|uniref:Uncharacterized protein n=1 Tax=Dermacentor silvarum TaxID=543639 RepID=A0ACB8DXM9_DERSI|nr:hypothetical protein HPB49_008354 [Dermacentor silvarum]